jgi:hypothetical protein
MTQEAAALIESRTVHDPFLGKDVEISNRLIDRLRGRYATGPIMPNGESEFGWREFPTPPIQHEAADLITALTARVAEVERERDDLRRNLFPYADDKEISGLSLNGFYWIGNKRSIGELLRFENRSSQVDVFRKAYDDRIAAAERALATTRADAFEEAAKIAESVGNFRDYKRDELTEDFGQPRFDMMRAIAAAIRTASDGNASR